MQLLPQVGMLIWPAQTVIKLGFYTSLIAINEYNDMPKYLQRDDDSYKNQSEALSCLSAIQQANNF